MKVLVIGGGGREHTIVWKLKPSKQVEKIYCIPGNGGIAEDAECVNLEITDFPALIGFAEEKNIDLTIVGPEAPLVTGIVDAFREKNLKIFGPDKKSAQLEGSKIFAKNFMKKYNMPTAEFKVFDNSQDAISYITHYTLHVTPSLVVKADGLAAGKGVIVCATFDQAKEAVEQMMVKKIFGQAGEKIIIEEKLKGEEATVLAFCDGKTLIPLPASQDHKPIFDNDKGPNTGGMGAYAPAPIINEKIRKKIDKEIFANFIKGINAEKLDYRGIIYFGLMITEEGPKVLEFNCRFGDPEAQVTLPLLNEDLVDLCLATIDKNLSDYQSLTTNHQSACSSVCVVLASGGYPGDYEKGKEIFGLEETKKMQNITVFHAGTKRLTVNGERSTLVTNGGRVLGVTGLGENIEKAIKNTYSAVEKIKFEKMHYRRDIGIKAVRKLGS
jgi:phosphoribosylamine--glycine ligase